MQDDLNKLKNLVNAVHRLTEDEWTALSHIWTPFSAKRKEIVTRAGDTERFLYFVLDGIQRVYSHDREDREATIVFTYAPSFGGVLDSFLMQSPSRYHYEALSPSTFLRAPFSKLDQLMTLHPGINQMVRKGLTGALAGVMERLVELQSYSAEEKFNQVRKRSPHIFELIPHKYIANYLGMDPTNLSKLFTRLKN